MVRTLNLVCLFVKKWVECEESRVFSRQRITLRATMFARTVMMRLRHTHDAWRQSVPDFREEVEIYEPCDERIDTANKRLDRLRQNFKKKRQKQRNEWDDEDDNWN